MVNASNYVPEESNINWTCESQELIESYNDKLISIFINWGNDKYLNYLLKFCWVSKNEEIGDQVLINIYNKLNSLLYWYWKKIEWVSQEYAKEIDIDSICCDSIIISNKLWIWQFSVLENIRLEVARLLKERNYL